MEQHSTVLDLLYGRQPNRITRVVGAKRKVVDALIAHNAMKRALPFLWKNADSLAQSINVLQSQAVMARTTKSNFKYVHFNGHIFMDCFSPKFPGKAFNRFYDAFVRNLATDSKQLMSFIPSLVFSITKKCVYRCEHCYAIQSLGKTDVLSFDQLLSIARDFQKIGVGVMAWEGGEPLLRFDELLSLIRQTRDESESMLATTAHGLTDEKARQLREAGLDAAIISLDHYDPDQHNKFRGNQRAFDMAVNGVRIFRENGILPSIAICATRQVVADGGLYTYLELAKEIGAAFIQILDATPSGNYLGKEVMLDRSQLEEIKRFHIEVNSDRQYWDYPSIQARALIEDDATFGCCGGHALCYVDNSGNFQPCDLLQISFGNVLEEGVQTVYNRMREYFPHPSKGRCPAQTLHRDIANVYDRHPSLPLPYQECGLVLDKIARRGLPDLLAKVREKRLRKSLGEIFWPSRRKKLGQPPPPTP